MGKIKIKKSRTGRIHLFMGTKKLKTFKSKELATKYILDNGLNQYAKP